MSTRRFLLGLLLLGLNQIILGQYINPLKDPNICGRPTCKGGSKFKYGPEIQQTYAYSIDIVNLFNGTSKNESTLYIQSEVTLDFLSECDGILSISDVRLSEKLDAFETDDYDYSEDLLHYNSEIFSEEISQYTLRFSFQDGVISEICPDREESNWVLNFKRGLLSMLHNTMKRLDLDVNTVETDIKGKCETTYTIEGAKETSLVIKKIKNLNSCENRGKLSSILQSTPYQFKQKSNEESLMKSKSYCDLIIDHNVYKEIYCEETHVFQPFSNKAAGATTTVKQRLTLQSEYKGSYEEQPPITKRTSLLYDHVPTPKPTSGELKTSRDSLKQLCKLSVQDIQSEFSGLFTKFIHTARLLSYVALSSLYGHSSTICVSAKKHMIDALPHIGSDAAVALMKDVILKNGVPEDTIHDWTLTMAFIPRPSEGMMETAYELLEEKYSDSSITLGISSLAHTFCSQNVDCYSYEPIKQIVELLEYKATEIYRSNLWTPETQQSMLIFLKALANIGVLSDDFKDEIYEIIKDRELHVAIRIAAVQCFRRSPCEQSRPFFEEFYRNQDEDAEVRISAYLQIMRCPNYLVIRAIQHSLEIEEVNQVGSFIWSHLHNLLKSSIPSRVEIQSLLSDKDLTKKFSSDVRKFSHNFEGSMFFEEYNVGGNYESNVIFSPSSYIPRTAMLNLTIDLFGESINLLEVDGRVEGLEHYLESIFGPKGPLNAENLQNKIPKMRWPRSTSENEILKYQIDELPNVMKNQFSQPRVSLGVKVFGNELKHSTFNGEEEIKAALNSLSPVDSLKRILSGKEINYNKAAMFLDSSYVIPSGAGFPITLNAMGTASVNLKLFGAMRAADFMKTKEMDLVGDFRPSAAVDIVGTISVDAYYASTAIKLKTNMYTSSAVEGTVKVRGTDLVSVKFSLPWDKTEIFGAHSELIVVNENIEHQQKGIEYNRVSEAECSWPIIDKAIGLKLCAHYHFTNVTKTDYTPYFILAGPAGFGLSLQKADLTAKTYILEYKWIKSDSGSVISVTLDTPGSNVRRLLGANLTLDTQTNDITLLLHSSTGMIAARGKYKNTKTEKYLQVVLDIDNKKHFDASFSLEEIGSGNKHTYIPKIYLGVNRHRVAELQGNLKLVTKKGITQCDVDLKFQTKRLTSKLFGYISKSGASFGTNLKLDYKFVNTKEQRAIFEFLIANRSTLTIVAILGDMRVETTAYPHFNFEAAIKFQRSAGRMEYKFEANSSPDLHNLELNDPNRLSLILEVKHKTTQHGTNFETKMAVKKDAIDLDLGAEFLYYGTGPNNDIKCLFRYGKEKEVTAAIVWSRPRGALEYNEGRVNITVPAYTPLLFKWKVREKRTSNYDVELSATWFSGHSIKVRGIYQHKNSVKASSQHVKMILQSPSFQEIDVDCHYYLDNNEIKLDFKANQDNDNYGFLYKHIVASPFEISTEVRIKYKTQIYSITSLLNVKERKQILLELHLDQLRDIHLAIWGHNKEFMKTAGLEIKWDANRDPNQKLAVTVEYHNPKAYKYDGNFVISYPGRTIYGFSDFTWEGNHFLTTSHLSWNPVDKIGFKFGIDYKYDIETLILLNLEVISPMVDWKKTSFNAGYQYKDNMRCANSSLHWGNNQYISINLFRDYEITTTSFETEVSAAILSTLQDFPSFSSKLKHYHNITRLDTFVHVMYHPKKVISVKSSWRFDKDNKMKNLTGTVSLVSPFEGYNKGLLLCKIYATNTKDLRGAADLDLDHKKYTVSVEGYYHKLTDNMFEFNATSPIEKYRKLTGQLGFSEKHRHLVALVKYSTGTIGIETKFLFESLEEFDIKLYASTPIDILQKILIRAKLQTDMADFRLGWNSLLAGFFGVWHYANITDFEYTYKIYTPIEGFERNGIVAKLIYKEGLDFEVSMKLAKNRLGIMIGGQPKPKILDELGIKTQAIYSGKVIGDEVIDYEDYEDESEILDAISWSGLIEIDTVIYPTMKGTLDIDQKGALYVLLGTLALPGGLSEFKNEFEFINLLTMKNQLHITTPYKNFKVITSSFDIEVIMSNLYQLHLDFNYQNETRWIQTGGSVYYFTEDEDEEAIHNVTFQIHTPFETFPRLDLRSALEMKDTVYRFSFGLKTITNDVLVNADAKIDNNFLETNLSMYMVTPVIVVPPSKFNFKKDFSENENKIELHFDMIRNKPSKFNIMTIWKFHDMANFRANLAIETPITGLEEGKLSTALATTKNNGFGELYVSLYPVTIQSNATLKNNILNSWTLSEFKGHRREIVLNCKLSNVSPTVKNVDGELTINNEEYAVSGTMEKSDSTFPTKLHIQIKSQGSDAPFHIQYVIQPVNELSGHILLAKLSQGQNFIQIEGKSNRERKGKLYVNLKISTSNKLYKPFIVETQVLTHKMDKKIIVKAQTPFENLEDPYLSLLYRKTGKQRYSKLDYEIGSSRGTIESEWCWVVMENMTIKFISNSEGSNLTRKTTAEIFYVNPNTSFNSLRIGGNANVDGIWKTDNLLKLSSSGLQNIKLEAISKLPSSATHKLDGNIYSTENWDNIRYSVKYVENNSGRNYGIWGNVIYPDETKFTGRVNVDLNKNRIDNYLDWFRLSDRLNFHYKLRTPKFSSEDTLTTNFSYLGSELYHNVTCKIFYPASHSIVAGQVDFQEFANMNGTVNITTPFKTFKYLASHFRTETSESVHNRFVELYWPEKKAYLDSKCTTTIGSSALERDTVGLLLVKIPLTTSHHGKINYNYSGRPNKGVGYATVDYNNEKIVDGKYTCLSTSKAGFSKDTVHVELENKLIPIGVAYIHGYENNVPKNDFNAPTVDSKRIEVYHLHNRTGFNVTGEMLLRNTVTGREIVLMAIHSNRIIKFSTDYDILEQQFKQNSKLELTPDIWISYYLDILNKTMDDNVEAQQIQINLSYPKRNITALGSYNNTDNSFSSEMSLVWDEQRRRLEAAFDWKRDQAPHYSRQEMELQFRHPSFEKNAYILGIYETTPKKWLELNLTADYSTNPKQKLELSGAVENLSRSHLSNYTYRLWGKHPSTNLHLDARGGVWWRPQLYNTRHLLDYKRSYLPMQSREILGRIDINRKEMEFKKKSVSDLSYFWGRYSENYPLYTANLSAIHGKDINASGEFYLNLKEKLIQLELNMTEDASQSVHMFGEIPDARSASFNIWRDYEDIRVSDVSYLLKLNHSRLIVSNLNWRPEIKQEIRNGIRAMSIEFYNDIMDNADYWKQYIRSETVDAIAGVWHDAKPVIRDFLDDLNDLKTVENDIHELNEHLQEAYEANEFYMHDVVNFTLTIVDELSIRSHIESLPKIFNEIWEAMGATKEQIQKRILWVVEKIKTYYKNTMEFINRLIQGDALEHLSEICRRLIEDYDNFIKELHVSFIRFLERLWMQTYAMLLDNWYKTLAAIEPTFIKMLHYLETVVWHASKDFLDFLYVHKADIMESPHFERLAILSQDVDKFYKDMTGNNTIWNAYKYTKMGWNFIKEKYFNFIPFAKELEDVVTEIITELNELRNLPTIHYFSQKFEDFYANVKWFCNYFEIESRLQHLITLIHLKMTDLSETALQTENRYREAKTKFIFEPNDGIVYLEQKLPMSWHAFNETPKLQEIPEYKVMNDLQNYFTTSKTNFWNFYYDYKPYTDPNDWLPPFKAQAMLAGSQYYVTFDRVFYDFRGQCSYLLVSDFLDRNFSMAISYDIHDSKSYELIIVVNSTVIHLNAMSGITKVVGANTFKLPLQIDDVYIYQESDIVTLESKLGFALQCNMKFDVCMLEISGWYFGKTAGLWGTMNNEPSDDLLTSDKKRVTVNDIGSFAQSWALDRKCSSSDYKALESLNTPEDIASLCEVFFSSTVSPFVTCFPRVSSDPFLKMCLHSLTEKEACTSAVAYMNLCAVENTPLRIPEACVKCNLLNGSVVPEGEFILFEANSISRSTDVVFIIEAKECNRDLRSKRNLDMMTSVLHKELEELNITQNRYSVVVFGGNGVFDSPRSIIANNKEFVDYRTVNSYLDNIPVGKGNSDIFGAIIYSSKLIFRPGASKTFILLPCTDCHESNMKLDYTILHQLLLENDITLHILMNEEFRFEKMRVNKIFFGIDRTYAYTKKDVRNLKGDSNLLKQVRLPKSTLGFCTPLALETNGSLFTANKLEADKTNAVRRFITVFSKRVAQSALPSKCQLCECTAPNTGISYMECFPCNYPTRATIDYGFNEDETLSFMQPTDDEEFDSSIE